MLLAPWALGLMLITGQAASTPAPWVTVSDNSGNERLSFVVQAEPFRPGTLPRGGETRTVRDSQGRTITGFSYYAWNMGSSMRVLVLAVVPAGEADEPRPGMRIRKGRCQAARHEAAGFQCRVATVEARMTAVALTIRSPDTNIYPGRPRA